MQEGGRRKEWNWESKLNRRNTKNAGLGQREGEGIYNYVGCVSCDGGAEGWGFYNYVLLLPLPALRTGEKAKMIRSPSTEGKDENEMIKVQQCCESRTRKSKMALKKRGKYISCSEKMGILLPV